jgi:two-component system, NarL family, sensor histidine kinase DesK
MSLLLAGPAGNDGMRLSEGRRVILSLVVVVILLQPYLKIMQHGPHSARQWFELAGGIALAAIVVWVLSTVVPRGGQAPWPAAVVMLGLAIGLLVVGGPGSLGATAIAAAIWGRNGRTPLPAVFAAAVCALTGLLLAGLDHYPSGNIFSVLVIAPLAAFFAYSAAKRVETLDVLRRTRAELVRAAADEERLRIARDLHDLLGHSLSLITLKAELAGRLVATDPDRAAREIGDLESVARHSLSDVRAAVAGYRQPDLAGELAAARQLLDAAGIAAEIVPADAGPLPQEVDSVLAWAVREGATNVVRHSRATRASITISVTAATAEAEIRDNGPAAAAAGPRLSPAAVPRSPGRDRPPVLARYQPELAGSGLPGSGLAGLAERVRALGGQVAAGAADGRGFLLRVTVPLGEPF